MQVSPIVSQRERKGSSGHVSFNARKFPLMLCAARWWHSTVLGAIGAYSMGGDASDSSIAGEKEDAQTDAHTHPSLVSEG